MKDPEKFILLLFPIFFVGIWFFVLSVIAKKSGWTALVERFHFPELFQGKLYRFQSARLNWCSFNRALSIGVNDRGLYLSPMIIFRFGYKPLLIPWHEIRAVPVRKFLFKGYRLTFRSMPNLAMTFSERTFMKMSEFVQDQPNVP